MSRVILLSGPPKAGKDESVRQIQTLFPRTFRLGFADCLKDSVHAAYGMPGVPFDHFEAVKDEPRDEFFGSTPRQAYIAFSETFF